MRNFSLSRRLPARFRRRTRSLEHRLRGRRRYFFYFRARRVRFRRRRRNRPKYSSSLLLVISLPLPGVAVSAAMFLILLYLMLLSATVEWCISRKRRNKTAYYVAGNPPHEIGRSRRCIICFRWLTAKVLNKHKKKLFLREQAAMRRCISDIAPSYSIDIPWLPSSVCPTHRTNLSVGRDMPAADVARLRLLTTNAPIAVRLAAEKCDGTMCSICTPPASALRKPKPVSRPPQFIALRTAPKRKRRRITSPKLKSLPPSNVSALDFAAMRQINFAYSRNRFFYFY